MLPVVLLIFFTGFASATYYLNQPSPPLTPNRIDQRPVVYGGGGYPAPNPLFQNIYSQIPGYPPFIQRVPVPFNPKPVAGRPVALSAQASATPTASELLALLTSHINNGGVSPDLYEGYEEKGQADPDKLAKFRNNIVLPADNLRTSLPAAVFQSTVRDNEVNVTEKEDDLNDVITLTSDGNGMVLGMSQMVGNGLPASPTGQLIAVKVVPQGTPSLPQLTNTKQTVAEINNELQNGLEAYTLQLNGNEEKVPGIQLVTSAAIDGFPERGEPLDPGNLQPGVITPNAAVVGGLRAVPLYGNLLLIPNGSRLSKSIHHVKSEDVETTEATPNYESEAAGR